MRRVDTALRQVLAEAVARELSDPRLGFVTITHVEATQDVREAKVWFTTLEPGGAGAEPGGARVGPRRAAGQASPPSSARRHTPQLTFVYDSRQEDAVALTALIDEVTDSPEEDRMSAPPTACRAAEVAGGARRPGRAVRRRRRTTTPTATRSGRCSASPAPCAPPARTS